MEVAHSLKAKFCSLEGGDWREKLSVDSISLQENWQHQDSFHVCSNESIENLPAHNWVRPFVTLPIKGGVELSQFGMISHRLSGTGMDDPLSCFKLEVPIIRSSFLPLVNLDFWKEGLTVKAGRLCFCWSCTVVSVMQKFPWSELWNCRSMGSCSGCSSQSDWLPEHVNWKELGSSPNLWFSEAYAVFMLLKARCTTEMEFVATIKDLGKGYISLKKLIGWREGCSGKYELWWMLQAFK